MTTSRMKGRSTSHPKAARRVLTRAGRVVMAVLRYRHTGIVP